MHLWQEHLGQVPDPRRQSALLKHPLLDILTIALCATIAGAESFVEFEWWGQRKQQWLREHMGLELPSGVPSHDTFRRVLARLCPQALGACLWQWTQQLQRAAQGQTPSQSQRRHLAIDGKTLRGTWEAATGVCALSVVSVWASEMKLTLAQQRVPVGQSELATVKPLLELLELQGAVISADAFYCQKEVARQIVEKKADYVLCLKENQGGLYREVQEHFRWCQEHRKGIKALCDDWHEERDYQHGRHEVRRAFVLQVTALDWPQLQQQWPGVQSLVLVERQRASTSAAAASVERRFYLSSLPPEACLLAQSVRRHWSIENTLHWVLDVAFEEDHCRTRRDNAAHNLATLRRLALNLLHQKKEKVGVRARRKGAGWDDAYLFEILTRSCSSA